SGEPRGGAGVSPGVERGFARARSTVGGAPGGIRTHDPQLRKLVLYPLSYGRNDVAEREGFEPSEQVTPLGGLANRCTRPLCDLSSSGGILASGSRGSSRWTLVARSPE